MDAKIKASKVLASKNWRDWDFNILLELFEKDGCLWTESQSLFNEYLEKTKFFKRLLSFYMPSKQRFVDMRWQQESLICARVGYLLIKTFLKYEAGIQTLLGTEIEMFATMGTVILTDNPFH